MARAACDGFGQRRQHDLIGVREAGFLARERAHADALLDAVTAFLDDAVFERPGLLARQLEIQVGVVDAVPHDVAEHARDAIFVEARRRQDRAARDVERLKRTSAVAGSSMCSGAGVMVVALVGHRWHLRVDCGVTSNLRCDSAGKRPRSSCCNVRSISATARPGPGSATRASTWPHGSTIIESP